MLQPDKPKWDPLYDSRIQVPAPPLLPIYYKDFTLTANKAVLGYDVGSASHLVTHLYEIPQLRGLLKKALSKREIDFDAIEAGERIIIEQDMGRPVGTTDQVRLTDAHDVYYAIRENREKEEIYTKFVRDGVPTPTSWLTGVVKGVRHPRYKGIVHTAWTGPHAPPFPHSRLALDNPDLFRKGVEFWSGDIALSDANMSLGYSGACDA